MGVIKDCSESLNLVANEFERSIPELRHLERPLEFATEQNLHGLASTLTILKRFQPE